MSNVKYIVFGKHLGYIDDKNKYTIIYFQPWSVFTGVRTKDDYQKNLELGDLFYSSIISSVNYSKEYRTHVKAALEQLANE